MKCASCGEFGAAFSEDDALEPTGGLILLGTTVTGIAESFYTGHTVKPLGNLGDVVIHPSFDPALRAGLIA